MIVYNVYILYLHTYISIFRCTYIYVDPNVHVIYLLTCMLYIHCKCILFTHCTGIALPLYKMCISYTYYFLDVIAIQIHTVFFVHTIYLYMYIYYPCISRLVYIVHILHTYLYMHTVCLFIYAHFMSRNRQLSFKL